MTPYRKSADMPEVKIKKEWCFKGSEPVALLALFPVGIGAMIWLVALVSVILVWKISMADAMPMLRGLAMIVGYVVVWSAIFMRRREVKE